MARYWHGKSPIGEHITITDAKLPPMKIVGVVGDMMHNPYDRDPRRCVYVSYQQAPARWMDIGIRTAGNPLLVAPNVSAAIRAIDPEQPISEMQSMEKAIHDRAIGLQYVEIFMGVFGVLALVLSAVGVYGVMAYMVGRRTREIGIRMALGAEPRHVLSLVIRQGMVLTAIGVAVGLGAAFMSMRLIEGLLYGVSATDGATFAIVALILSAVSLAACWIPARRATKVDPMIALRYE